MTSQIMNESTQSEQEEDNEQPLYISPILQNLEPELRPAPSPACASCPVSVWFSNNEHLKCFCGKMHAIVWDDENEPPILKCDGRELAILALLEAKND